MKRILAIVAAVAAVLFGVVAVAGCSSSSASGPVQTVSPQEWITAASQSGVTIIDVRTPAEYAAGHVAGAINIDVEGGSFDSQIAQLDKNATYAVYCHSGRRSGIATTAMGSAGFTHVYNLKGGIADLQAAGAQIVTG